MDNKLILFIRNFSYTLSSNIISLSVNGLILLIIPKIVGIAEYGYIQYYTLLGTYIVFLHCGWNDGIYLRYGGQKYDELDSHTFSQQFWGIVIFSLVQVTLYLILLNNINIDNNKYFVFLYAIFAMLIILPRIFISTVLQVSNRMKEFSISLITERIFYVILLTIMLIYGIRDFKVLLIGDLIGKLFSLVYGAKCCSNIVFHNPKFNKKSFVEIKENIGVGIFLLLSNLCSILITGIVQFFIENKWNIETFSKVALTFNISRMLMLIINSVSIVIFPLLKNTKNEELPALYEKIRKLTMIILLAILIFYYPMRVMLSIWLPQYADSFKFVALLLPICIFESKSSMLVSTYLKVLRKETVLFSVNFIMVLISFLFSFITVYLLSSLELAILSITVVLGIKSILLEFFVSKIIEVQIMNDTIIEILMVLIFISCSWFIDSWFSFLIYLVVYCIYLLANLIKPIKY